MNYILNYILHRKKGPCFLKKIFDCILFFIEYSNTFLNYLIMHITIAN